MIIIWACLESDLSEHCKFTKSSSFGLVWDLISRSLVRNWQFRGVWTKVLTEVGAVVRLWMFSRSKMSHPRKNSTNGWMVGRTEGSLNKENRFVGKHLKGIVMFWIWDRLNTQLCRPQPQGNKNNTNNAEWLKLRGWVSLEIFEAFWGQAVQVLWHVTSYCKKFTIT